MWKAIINFLGTAAASRRAKTKRMVMKSLLKIALERLQAAGSQNEENFIAKLIEMAPLRPSSKREGGSHATKNGNTAHVLSATPKEKARTTETQVQASHAQDQEKDYSPAPKERAEDKQNCWKRCEENTLIRMLLKVKPSSKGEDTRSKENNTK